MIIMIPESCEQLCYQSLLGPQYNYRDPHLPEIMDPVDVGVTVMPAW